jgi:hypothetical protein
VPYDIYLLEGEYLLNATLLYFREINIYGRGVDQTILRQNPAIPDTQMGGMIDTGPEAVVRLYNVTIRDGRALATNVVERGGAWRLNQSRIFIYSSKFENNQATIAGGAIYNLGGSVTIRNTIFSDNRATFSASNTFGGAIFSGSSANPSLDLHCIRFISNDAGANGGAIGLSSTNRAFTVGSSAFVGNTAGSSVATYQHLYNPGSSFYSTNARNNWWQDPTIPAAITYNVDATSQLASDPTAHYATGDYYSGTCAMQPPENPPLKLTGNDPGRAQEALDMQAVANAQGVLVHVAPALNAVTTGTTILWGETITANGRVEFPRDDADPDVWYRLTAPAAGWVAVRYDGFAYLQSAATGNPDPLSSAFPLPPTEDITFPYDRDRAAQFAIAQSYHTQSGLPVGGGTETVALSLRVTTRIPDTLPFASFSYNFLDPDASATERATGSAVFISEVLWMGGIPMTVGRNESCSDESADSGDGWRVCEFPNAFENASSPWRLHEWLVPYFVGTSLSINEDAVNAVFDNSSSNRGQAAGSIEFDDPSFNRYFINEDVVSGEVRSAAELAQVVQARLGGNLQRGDYVWIDPEGFSHGFVIVGWGQAMNCAAALAATFDINSLEADGTQGGVPYVVDFTRLQQLIPRPFYCAVFDDNTGLPGTFDRVSSWYFFTISNEITIPISGSSPARLYVDPALTWEAGSGTWDNTNMSFTP